MSRHRPAMFALCGLSKTLLLSDSLSLHLGRGVGRRVATYVAVEKGRGSDGEVAQGTGARETREREKGWRSASSSAVGRSGGQLGCVGPFVQR